MADCAPLVASFGMSDEDDDVHVSPELATSSICSSRSSQPFHKTHIAYIRSRFPNRRSVVYFESFLEPRHISGNPTETKASKPLTFYHGKKVHRYNCVINTLKHAGLSEQSTKLSDSATCCLVWNNQPEPDLARSLGPLVKFNHFPASWHLGRKDLLADHLNTCRRTHGNAYDFFPTTYVLPRDQDRAQTSPVQLWIWKPTNASCGRGIKLIQGCDLVDKKKLLSKPGILQRYISRPLLIEGRKFDLRIYVLVTSYDPLKVYVYGEGLVRRASQPYDTKKTHISSTCMHLTNYSVNRKTPDYLKHDDRDDEENINPIARSKWSLEELRIYLLKSQGIAFEPIFENIKKLAVKTIMAVEPVITTGLHQSTNYTKCKELNIRPYGNMFEIYGFDVLIDEDLKPWLLEVNVEPSLSSSSPFDKRVKTGLVADALMCAGILDRRGWKAERPREAGSGKVRNVLAFKGKQGVEEFDDSDWDLVFETADEWTRTGKWIPVFPDGVAQSSYLSTRRYNNEVLERWLKYGAINLLDCTLLSSEI